MTEPLAIYVHWPFCDKKCPYCDFNSHEAEQPVDHGRWARAYEAELERFATETAGRAVASIFFGGGTPSLMDPRTIDRVIEKAGTLWTLTADVEITAEANPGSSDRDRFQDFFAAGINRLSLGVQSLDDGQLKFLGRIHDADEARRAIAAAAKVFPRTSFDLIYALPGQRPEDWRRQLDEAVALAGGHFSAYQLTIERGTRFHADGVRGAGEDDAAAMYEITGETLGRAGLAAYEISNHARTGEESRHNLAYWRGGDYIGVGPGAHGRLTTTAGTAAVQEIRAPGAWLEAVETTGAGSQKRTNLSAGERIEELIMMGLRLAEGLSAQRFAAQTGRPLDDCVDSETVTALIDAGYLVADDAGMRATQAGRLRLDAMLARLLV